MNRSASILIIDDDPAMSAGIRDNLEIEGYRVQEAATLRQGREWALLHRPDLILLDLMLPDGNGVDLCRQLRIHGVEQPIIMLTALGEEKDKLLGFGVGADDYMVKPFSLAELLARVNVHLRRNRVAGDADLIPVGVAMADFKRHRLTCEGNELTVSAKEMDLLRFLVEHRGIVVSREWLLSQVWGHQRETTTRTVDNFVVRLRKKIEPLPAEPRYLITVHGAGYKLVEQ